MLPAEGLQPAGRRSDPERHHARLRKSSMKANVPRPGFASIQGVVTFNGGEWHWKTSQCFVLCLKKSFCKNVAEARSGTQRDVKAAPKLLTVAYLKKYPNHFKPRKTVHTLPKINIDPENSHLFWKLMPYLAGSMLIDLG